MSISKSQSATAARTKLVSRRGELARLCLNNATDGADLRQDLSSRERTTGEEIAEVLVSLSDRERLEVAAIDAAIVKIDAGTWGHCTRCDDQIGVGRLAAMPEAIWCVDCAAAAAERS